MARAEEVPEDKPWIKPDKSKSPSDSSSEALKIFTAGFQIGALAANLGGPPGQIVGAVFSTVATTLPLFEPGQNPLNETQIREVVLRINREERAKRYIDAAYTFDHFVLVNQGNLELQPNGGISLANDKIEELKSWVEPNGRLGRSWQALNDEARRWDNPAARISIVSCITRQLTAYSMLCRLYAQIALSARKQGDRAKFLDYKGLFDGTINTMTVETRVRTDNLNALLKELEETRLAQYMVVDGNTKEAVDPSSSKSRRVLCLVDKYTNKSIFSENPKGAPGTALTPAYAAYFEMKPLLRGHIQRCLQTTRRIIDSWGPILEETKRYLSVMPRVLREEKCKVSAWYLPDDSDKAPTGVAYAWRLLADNDEQEESEYTDWFIIQFEGWESDIRGMPVIEIDDLEYPTETTRYVCPKKIIYHPDSDSTEVVHGTPILIGKMKGKSVFQEFPSA